MVPYTSSIVPLTSPTALLFSNSNRSAFEFSAGRKILLSISVKTVLIYIFSTESEKCEISRSILPFLWSEQSLLLFVTKHSRYAEFRGFCVRFHSAFGSTNRKFPRNDEIIFFFLFGIVILRRNWFKPRSQWRNEQFWSCRRASLIVNGFIFIWTDRAFGPVSIMIYLIIFHGRIEISSRQDWVDESRQYRASFGSKISQQSGEISGFIQHWSGGGLMFTLRTFARIYWSGNVVSPVPRTMKQYMIQCFIALFGYFNKNFTLSTDACPLKSSKSLRAEDFINFGGWTLVSCWIQVGIDSRPWWDKGKRRFDRVIRQIILSDPNRLQTLLS